MELYRRDEIVLLSLVYVVLVVYCRKIVSASRTIGTKMKEPNMLATKCRRATSAQEACGTCCCRQSDVLPRWVPNFEFRIVFVLSPRLEFIVAQEVFA